MLACVRGRARARVWAELAHLSFSRLCILRIKFYRRRRVFLWCGVVWRRQGVRLVAERGRLMEDTSAAAATQGGEGHGPECMAAVRSTEVRVEKEHARTSAPPYAPASETPGLATESFDRRSLMGVRQQNFLGGLCLCAPRQTSACSTSSSLFDDASLLCLYWCLLLLTPAVDRLRQLRRSRVSAPDACPWPPSTGRTP